MPPAKAWPAPRSIFNRLTLDEGSEMVIVGVAPTVFSVRLRAFPAPGQFKSTVGAACASVVT